MSVKFSAQDAFEMAIHIEQNGAAFYRKAASLNADEECRAYLVGLAAVEEEHERTFRKMREQSAAQPDIATDFDPSGEGEMYLDALADRHGGEGSVSAAEALTGNESLVEILRTAVELEKKSILFYIGLQDMVPPDLGRDRVLLIIGEEKGHVASLMSEIKKREA